MADGARRYARRVRSHGCEVGRRHVAGVGLDDWKPGDRRWQRRDLVRDDGVSRGLGVECGCLERSCHRERIVDRAKFNGDSFIEHDLDELHLGFDDGNQLELDVHLCNDLEQRDLIEQFLRGGE